MGQNKALLEVGGMAMARRISMVVGAAGCHPVVAVGGEPAQSDQLGLAWVADEHPGEGPLGGVITALQWNPGDAVLVVACDLPLLTEGVVGELLAMARQHPAADVVIARAGRPQPLCAVWRPAALPALVAAFESGERAMHRMVERLEAQYVDVAELALTNVNEPGDVPLL
jgi:molybdopterin-guanine dinucleotide biosynthesis protein A